MIQYPLISNIVISISKIDHNKNNTKTLKIKGITQCWN